MGEAMSIFQKNLETALPLLEEAGVVGLLEPINPWSLPDYNLDSFQDAVQIVEAINHPKIRLQLDLLHLQQLEGNISRRVKELLPLVGHIQIAQVPHRGEPDSAGEIDYRYILNLLESLQYEGWVGLEYKPAGVTEEGL